METTEHLSSTIDWPDFICWEDDVFPQGTRSDPKLVNSVCPKTGVIDLKNSSKQPSPSVTAKQQEGNSSPKDNFTSRTMSRKRKETRYTEFSSVGHADREDIRCPWTSPEDPNGKDGENDCVGKMSMTFFFKHQIRVVATRSVKIPQSIVISITDNAIREMNTFCLNELRRGLTMHCTLEQRWSASTFERQFVSNTKEVQQWRRLTSRSGRWELFCWSWIAFWEVHANRMQSRPSREWRREHRLCHHPSVQTRIFLIFFFQWYFSKLGVFFGRSGDVRENLPMNNSVSCSQLSKCAANPLTSISFRYSMFEFINVARWLTTTRIMKWKRFNQEEDRLWTAASM